ncbi:MAG: alcohol dehydrogenase catalytic domain-containing protein [Thermoleophilia bacterium]
MRAAVYHGPRDIRVETVPDPVCGERDLVLRVTACGVCGSDLHSYTKGLFVEPGQIMGHEFAGEVVEIGRLVEGVRVGDRVTASPAVDCGRCARCIAGEPLLCQDQAGNIISGGFPGGFAEYLRVPSARPGQSVFVLPEGVTDEVGATTEPMGVGLRAAHHAAPSAYDTCVVFGLGMIGQVAVQALKVAGAERVIGVDVARQRLDAAAALGADVVVDASEGQTLARLIELTGGGSARLRRRRVGQADVVVECTGVPRCSTRRSTRCAAAGRSSRSRSTRRPRRST